MNSPMGRYPQDVGLPRPGIVSVPDLSVEYGWKNHVRHTLSVPLMIHAFGEHELLCKRGRRIQACE
jgi:hypothetical protein